MEMNRTRRAFGKSVAAGLGSFVRVLPGAVRTTPKLLILIVAEQFRPDYLDRTDRYLGPGGFRRLMDEGTYFPDCRCAASTFTSSAIATLATGCWPDVHGVVADQWYDRTARGAVPARAETLLAGTVMAQIAALPRTRLFLCAMNERQAGLLQGTAPVRGFFMNAGGQFTTKGGEPAWLTEYNRLHAIENVHDAKWVALGAGADVPPLRTLAFESAHPERFFALYRSSPFAQEGQFEFIRELIAREHLGQEETQDLLVVSLGALAQLGHEVGGDSPLVDQLVLHLDRELDVTIDGLNKAPGAGNFALAFTGAHGAPPAPEPARRARLAVPGEALARSLDRALAERYDTATVRSVYVEKYVYPFLYLRPEVLRTRNARDVRAAAGRAALANPAVAGYYTADGDCSHHGEWERRFRNSFHALRSGDVMLAYQPGCVEDFGGGRGISYGSLYNYDARVPLFFFGPQFRGGVCEDTVEAIDIAPTLARLAGAALPSSSTGRVLSEAFADVISRFRR